MTTHIIGYLTHHKLSFPPKDVLLDNVNAYMTAYNAREEAQTRAATLQRQVPDADGFITVTKGGRNGVAKLEEAKEKLEKQKEKQKGLDDFYRFQSREKRKEKTKELLRQFEEDKKRVQKMKETKGRFNVSTSTLLMILPRLTDYSLKLRISNSSIVTNTFKNSATPPYTECPMCLRYQSTSSRISTALLPLRGGIPPRLCLATVFTQIGKLPFSSTSLSQSAPHKQPDESAGAIVAWDCLVANFPRNAYKPSLKQSSQPLTSFLFHHPQLHTKFQP